MQSTTKSQWGRYALAACLMLMALSPARAEDAAPVSLDESFAQMRSYPVGGPAPTPQYIIDQIMASHGDAARRADIAARLIDLLAPDTTFEAKRFAGFQLCIVGTEAQVPAIAPLLLDESLSDIARYALEHIPGEAADVALRDALSLASGKVQLGIVNSLGERKSAAATSALATLLARDDLALVQAATAALAKIGGADARAALVQAFASSTGPTREILGDGLLSSADALQASGDAAGAVDLYTMLDSPDVPRRLRFAALRGLLQADEAGRVNRLTTALASDDSTWARDAIGFARQLPGSVVTVALAEALSSLPESTQALLIGALANRADPAARAAVQARLDSADEAVRTAALAALGVLGDADSVAPLAVAAARATGDARDAARQSLYTLADESADKTMTGLLRKVEPDVRIELIRALAERGDTAAVPSLLRETLTKDADTRKEAYQALGRLASGDDVPALLQRLSKADTEDELDWASRAVVQAAQRIPAAEGPSKLIVAAYASAKKDDVRAALLGVLTGIGDDAGLPLVQGLTSDPNPVLHAAAVKALAGWETAAAQDALFAVLQSEPDDALQSTALEGYVRMLREDRSMAPENKFDRFAATLPLARSTASKRRVLSGLSDTPDVRALDLLAPYLGDAELGTEAAVATEKIRRQFYVATASHASENAKEALDMNIDTRWTTRATQSPGMWFQLDLAGEMPVGGVVLDASRSSGDEPRGYEVYVFNDPADMGAPVATGAGTEDVLEISFPPKTGRYLRIVQTGESGDHWWSIHEMRVIAK